MNLEIYETGREDLARLIACETSGVCDALPEQDDYDLADKLLVMINDPHRFD